MSSRVRVHVKQSEGSYQAQSSTVRVHVKQSEGSCQAQ